MSNFPDTKSSQTIYTRYIIQVVNYFGYYEDKFAYNSLEKAQKALPYWLGDYKFTTPRSRIVKEIREVAEE